MKNTVPNLNAFKRTSSLESSEWEMGNLTMNLAESTDTDGAFLLMKVTVAPGTEPPPHVHSREDELFYVLDGAFDVYVGADVFKVAAGECVFLPKLKPHGFVVRSPRLHALVLFTPGGLEGAFQAASVRATTLDVATGMPTYSTVDPQETARRFSEYGVRFLSPDEIEKYMPSFPGWPIPSASR